MAVEIYLRSKDTTEPRYGADPSQRKVEELLETGIVNLNKVRGPTSHQVVAWVKDILGIEKAGHGGTLDPKVSGVLPIALGRSTRVVKHLLKSDKSYVGVMTLHGDVDQGKLMEVFGAFTGKIIQTPPIKSAVKREPRERVIKTLRFLERKERDVLFEVTCEAGTYIRKLCRDMGEALLVGANMSELRRTRSGEFREEDSCTLQDLVDAVHYQKNEDDEGELRRVVLPIERFVDSMPKIWVRDTAVEALCNGAGLALPGVIKCESNVTREGGVAVMTLKDELIGIGQSRMPAKEIFEGETGIVADLSRVVMERGTYPRYWK
jgi:H/ACA ribonucleoprotein complex subunit 4